jgi:hypothetical protein
MTDTVLLREKKYYTMADKQFKRTGRLFIYHFLLMNVPQRQICSRYGRAGVFSFSFFSFFENRISLLE